MEFVNTPFNYTGSKYKLLEQLIPEFDLSKSSFLDLFCGGGSVYTNVIDKYDRVIVNDIIIDLIGIHKGLIESDDIIEQTKSLCPDKDDQEGYIQLRLSYNNDKSPSKLFALMLSCMSNLMRFNNSGKFNQSFGRRSFNPSTQKKVDEFTNHIRPYKDKIEFTSKHFNEVILIEPSMVYIDPPYGYCIDKNGQMSNYQISEGGYNVVYKKDDDIKLYEYIKKLNKDGHSFMLSGLLEHDGKKSWLLTKLISDGFRYKELDFDYNKASNKGNKISTEIIIMNYGR